MDEPDRPWRTGARIAEARRAAGLTQGDLAMRLGVTSAAVSGYERDFDHKESTLRRVASALDVSLSWLLAEPDAEPPRWMCEAATQDVEEMP